jgi:trans-2,3-dihydro-3-hydroxyanthranilate isomerase
MSASYRFHWLDVFTTQRFGGNQLVVFPDAQGLDPEQMPRIAREFNISETVFVLPPETPRGTRRVRIFTPASELPFAGHPTVGTAHALVAREGLGSATGDVDLVLEEGVGPVPVRVRREAQGRLFIQLAAAQPPALRAYTLDAARIAPLLNLAPSDLGGDVPHGMASAGSWFLIVPVRTIDAMERARLDNAGWERAIAEHVFGDLPDKNAARHIYLVCNDRKLTDADMRVRMFAPSLGIAEDPATGSAAAALAGHLASHAPDMDGTLTWTVEQGIEMGRPSTLYLEADKRDRTVTAVRVGGYAVWIGEGRLEVP